MTALAPTLQAFFTDRLALQRQASPPHDRRLPRSPNLAERGLHPVGGKSCVVRVGAGSDGLRGRPD